MGKIQLQKFEIVLSGNKNVYHLGEQVIGKCIIGLEGELQLSKIQMKLKGKAKVKFTKGAGKIQSTYMDQIKYLDMSYDFDRNYYTYNGMITKGIHELPFSYQLPNEGIPSSFAGFHGTIKYWIEAEIEKPMFLLNHKTRRDFKVEVPLICDNLLLPLSGSNEKNLGYFNHNSGNIRVDINIDKSAYIPGQSISVDCKITNYSSKCVTPRATLKQIQKYVVKGSRQIDETKYLIVEGTPVDCGLTNYETIQVPIPLDIELSLECPIIYVKYVLHLTTEIPSETNLHIDLPIIITTENILANPSAYYYTAFSDF